MKLFLYTFCFLISFSFVSKFEAQCTIDYTYTAPGIYPNPLPDGYAGQSYSEDITFVMPLDTMGATIQNFEIISIALPVGLDWICNNSSNGCNYNPQNDQYGCINIFGAPLTTGTFDIDVGILVDVVASGQNIDNIPIDFQISLTINNAAVGNTGFTSSTGIGCAPLDVDFTNNNPGLILYEWDFGNGQSSNLETPPTQTYTNPGNYPISYTAYSNIDTLDIYTLTEVTIENISGGWGPEYIPFVYTNGNDPDPYFIIYEDGSLIYQSSIECNEDDPVTWQVNINLDPNKSYELTVFDGDQTAATCNQSEVVFGSDDNLGTHVMNFVSCSNCTAGSNATVSTVIGYQQVNPVPSVQSADTISVGNSPGIPNIVYDSANYIVYTDSSQFILQWYLDSNMIAGHSDPIDTIMNTGNYYVIAYNSFGCSSISDTIYIVYCDPSISYSIDMNANLDLYTIIPVGHSVSWYENGILIPGANSTTFSPTNSGDYSAMILDLTTGCKYFTNPYTYSVGVEESNAKWWCFPNPAKDIVSVLWPQSLAIYEIDVFDMSGRLVSRYSPNQSPFIIDINDLQNGQYIIIGKSSKENIQQKIVIQH